MSNKTKEQLIDEVMDTIIEHSEAEKLEDSLNMLRHLLTTKQYGLDSIKHCRILIKEKLTGLQEEFKGPQLKNKVKTFSQAQNLQLTILSLIVLDRMCLLNIEAQKAHDTEVSK